VDWTVAITATTDHVTSLGINQVHVEAECTQWVQSKLLELFITIISCPAFERSCEKADTGYYFSQQMKRRSHKHLSQIDKYRQIA
jgi:hypothetical protein